MNAIILAAGFGTRLKPFTDFFPKPLIPVQGIPLILYNLALLKSQGIRDVVINVHHHAEVLPHFLGSGRNFGMMITYSREKEILGTGGGIRKALKFLNDDFFVLNGDIIIDCNLAKVATIHQKQRQLATFVLNPHPEAKRYGILSYKRNRLVSILGVPPVPKDAEGAMYGGVHCVNKGLIKKRLAQIHGEKSFCVIRCVYQPEIASGQKFGVSIYRGFWRVCDRPEDVLECEKKLKRRHMFSFQRELDEIVLFLRKQKIYQELIACRARLF